MQFREVEGSTGTTAALLIVLLIVAGQLLLNPAGMVFCVAAAVAVFAVVVLFDLRGRSQSRVREGHWPKLLMV